MHKIACPTCQGHNEPGAEYCGYCGTFLAEARTETSQSRKTPLPSHESHVTNPAEWTRGTVPRKPSRRLSPTVVMLGGLSAVFLLVLTLVIGIQLGSRQGLTTASPPSGSTAISTETTVRTATQASTQPEGTYPQLATQYAGTLHNSACVAGNSNGCVCVYFNGVINPSCDFRLTFSSVVQNQRQFSGVQSMNSLYGSGPFVGSITSDGKVSITVTSHDNVGTRIIIETGVVHPDGSMSGTATAYASVNPLGTWQVSPS